MGTSAAGSSVDKSRTQIFVNESRIYDTDSDPHIRHVRLTAQLTDGVEPGSIEKEYLNHRVHELLSVLERVFFLTKAEAIIHIDTDGRMSKREYFNGELIGVPKVTVDAIDGIQTKERFG